MNEIATPVCDKASIPLAGIMNSTASKMTQFVPLDVAQGLEQALRKSHKALDAIDRITSGDFLEELEMRDESKMDADLKQCMEALSLIFKIAHSESPNHTCHAVHKDWRDLKSKVLETSEP